MNLNYKIVWGTVSAACLGAPLPVLCFFFGSDKQAHYLNIILLILGLLLGWVIGILATPYTTSEDKKFTGYAKAISAFLSGFIIAKADKAIERLFEPQALTDPVVAFRLTMFAAAFLVALVITFIYRKYA
jgi:hypothetical protein